ncbi:MAG: EAL domain-containing protein [Motiliproteus sp.]|nr:EAL domain-containing protein [Motiliproteus sp.]MCW9051220.1 EAL domain-containing protein [Motiliproteus sp.]
MRQSLNIIFIGASTSDSEPFISLLRSARLAPRAELADSGSTLESMIKERQWDIIIFKEGAQISFEELGKLLKTLNKDIPVILLSPNNDPKHLVEGLKNKASAVVPADEPELMVLTIRRELYHLENRRRRRTSEFHLQETEKRCRELLHSSSHAVGFLNKDDQFIFLNPAFLELTGHENGTELLGNSITDLTTGKSQLKLEELLKQYHQDSRTNQEQELSITRKDGTSFTGNVLLECSRFERTPCAQITLTTPYDGNQIDTVAELDIVTGLKNQIFLGKRLERATQAAVRGGSESHLLFINLDNFNAIKAEIGVNGIDAVVRDVAEILQNLVNRAHVLTRYNLDAFTIIFADPDSNKALTLGEEICRAVEASLTKASGISIQTTCSVGITPITSDSSSAHDVLKLSQVAAEAVRSKNQKGNGVNLLVPEEQEEEEETLTIKKLRQAIQEDSLKLLFQPVVSLRGEHENIYEVLLRLIDKNDNEVSPNMFLTMLDHAEVSIELDRWVITESIRQLAEEHRKGNKNRLFINVTGRSLEDTSLLQWISQQLKEHDVPGNSLIFQLSESDASSYIKNANIFTQGLVQLHAGSCIKHYGSSIDSDNVLRHVPADFIKLDGSFVQELSDPEKHEAFDKLIEPLRLNEKAIIAPLVEGTNVMSKLFKSGIHYIQGYYLQAPREHMDYDFFQ